MGKWEVEKLKSKSEKLEVGFMEDNKTIRIIIGIVAPAMLFGGLFWQVERYRVRFCNSGYREVMGTFAQVTVRASGKLIGDKHIEAAFAKIHQINTMMNDWDPNSEISRLGQTAHLSPVAVSPELFEIIVLSKEYSRISNGAFDITVGAETQLWRQMQKTGQKPDSAALAAARAKVGYEKIILDENNRTVQFAVEGMKLDVGAIAKGYAADLAIESLKAKGVKAAMVDIGGNVRCFGDGPANGLWLIGLQDPRNPQNLLAKLKMNDMAVATSGDYERFAVVDGNKYSHILNPATAESVSELASVTIIAPMATRTDALSTAVSVLGAAKGMALIESLEQTECILILSSDTKKLIQSRGAGAFIVP